MMTAVEVLKWLWEHDNDGVYEQVFGADYVMFELINYLTPEEIVSRIEEYEKLDKELASLSPYEVWHSKKEPEFKVGDWVEHNKIGCVVQICWIYNNTHFFDKKGIAYRLNECEHADSPQEEELEEHCPICYYTHKQEWDYPCNKCKYGGGDKDFFTTDPKEEKQKIEPLTADIRNGYSPKFLKIICKVNELVNAVNELRGV